MLCVLCARGQIDTGRVDNMEPIVKLSVGATFHNRCNRENSSSSTSSSVRSPST
jgi:hypothetical protein